MKFIATAALIVAVNAACEEGGDNVCDPAENLCHKRTVTDVSNAKDSDYKKLLKTDDLLKKGDVKYECLSQGDSDAKMATSGTKDKKTTMTLTYEILQPVAAEGGEGEGSGASFIKGLSVAAALGLISYM